jgi:transposase-like protein
MILKKYQYNRNNNDSSAIISGKLKIIYKSWDEIYIKVKGQWIYMCGVVDSKGNTIDFYLRKNGKIKSAKYLSYAPVPHFIKS